MLEECCLHDKYHPATPPPMLTEISVYSLSNHHDIVFVDRWPGLVDMIEAKLIFAGNQFICEIVLCS